VRFHFQERGAGTEISGCGSTGVDRARESRVGKWKGGERGERGKVEKGEVLGLSRYWWILGLWDGEAEE
jgi:hypothetical protein